MQFQWEFTCIIAHFIYDLILARKQCPNIRKPVQIFSFILEEWKTDIFCNWHPTDPTVSWFSSRHGSGRFFCHMSASSPEPISVVFHHFRNELLTLNPCLSFGRLMCFSWRLNQLENRCWTRPKAPGNFPTCWHPSRKHVVFVYIRFLFTFSSKAWVWPFFVKIPPSYMLVL